MSSRNLMLETRPIAPDALSLRSNPPAEAVIAFATGFKQQMDGDCQKALASYATCISKSPAMFEAHFNAGLCYEKNGNTEAAIKSFEQVVSINHLYKPAFAHLSELHAKKGDEFKSRSYRDHYNRL